MVFGDISGFTKMSERLARHGKVGAEEVADAIDGCFEELLAVAYRCGGSLIKFGGDAVLLLFTGDNHATRAAHATVAMRARLRQVGRIDTSAGRVVLRISMGVHSGTFHLALVGGSHRELIAVGPGVTAAVQAEEMAAAGEIVMTVATSEQLAPSCRGPARKAGFLLRRPSGDVPDLAIIVLDPGSVDVARYVPLAIRDHLLGGGNEPEHRTATVAFLHFDGTDQLLADEGPAVLTHRLDRTIRVIQSAADDLKICFLGTDIDHDGGKIILVSGAPRRVGDDEQRMLLALRRIAECDDPGLLPLRIGVTAGAVFAGEVGPPYRRTYTTMGDTVNLAARLMATAGAGQILATSEVLDRSAAVFTTVELEPFLVKGKRHPVAASVVGALRRHHSEPETSFPFVGVDEPLAALSDALTRLHDGSGAVVEISGGHGMGKTRLMAELRVLAGPLPVISVNCESYDASTPYALTRVLGRALHGRSAGSVTEEALDASSTGSLPDSSTASTSALIGTGLGLDLPDVPATDDREPEQRSRAVARSTAGFLSEQLTRPSVVVIEDVQLMDEASQDIVAQMISLLDDQPVLVCLTRRDEPTGLQIEGPRPRRLAIAPLTIAQAVDALERAGQEHPMRPHEMRLLAERSAGNPLFLVELWRAHRSGSPLDSLPGSVDAAMTAEIDRLQPRLRGILRSAAVLGTAFTPADLRALIDEDTEHVNPVTRQASESTVPVELAPFLTAEDSGQMRFRSTSLRDCAYEGLPYRRRQMLHGRAAAALLLRLEGRASTEAELLSLHYFHAGDYPAAWRWGRLAGDRALARFANQAAATLYERTLAAGRRVAYLEKADLSSVWTGLGDARERSGQYPEATRAYRRARALLADDPVAQAEIFLKEAWMPERNGRYGEAVRWIRRGLSLLDGIPGQDAGRVRAQLTVWYASVRQAQGASREAVRWCDQAVAEARASGDRDAEAHALYILDWAWVTLGRPEQAVHSQAALAIYRDLGDQAGVAAVLLNMGGFAYFQGEWDRAVDLYRLGRDARLATGNEVDAAMCTANIGEVLSDQGHYDDAHTVLRQSHQVCRASGYRVGVGFTSMLLGRLSARTGNYGDAHQRYDVARREFVGAGLDGDIAQVDVLIVECLVLDSRSAEALDLADRLLSRPDADESALLRWRGWAMLQRGDRSGARSALAQAFSRAEEDNRPFEAVLTLDRLVHLTRIEGRDAETKALTADLHLRCTSLGIVILPPVPG